MYVKDDNVERRTQEERRAATRRSLLGAARELFAVVKKGAVKIKINQTYPLREAAQAHMDLQSRKTTGSTVLLP